LSTEERAAAVALSRALNAARAVYDSGERSGAAIEMRMHAILAQESLAQTQYAVVADPESLEPASEVDGHAVALMAVNIGSTRLIDNSLLGEDAVSSTRKP